MAECIDLTDLENSNLENVNFGAANSKKIKAEKPDNALKTVKAALSLQEPLSNATEKKSDEVVLSKSGPPQLKKDGSGTVDEDIEVLGTTGESVADWWVDGFILMF